MVWKNTPSIIERERDKYRVRRIIFEFYSIENNILSVNSKPRESHHRHRKRKE
jgi:hypothetical protein